MPGTGQSEVSTEIDEAINVAVASAIATGDNTIGRVKLTDGTDVALVTTAGELDVHPAPATDFEHFSNLDVDTAAEQLSAYACKFGVCIKADDDNSSSVYVGKSDVTAGTTDATDGFRLKAGQAISLAVSNTNLIYVIGGANNQKVFVIAT